MIRSISAHEIAVIGVKITYRRPPDSEIYDDEDDDESAVAAEADYEVSAPRIATQLCPPAQTVSIAQRQREELDARFAALEFREVRG